MTFNTVFSLSISTIIVWLLITPPAFGVPEKVPPDVLEARPGGYVYADYPDVFDAIEGDGITIEAWIYLTERPREVDFRRDGFFLGGWIVFAKPGSYFVTIIGGDRSVHDQPLPKGTAHIVFGVQRPDRNDWGITTRIIPPKEFPLRRWVHVADQIVVKRDGTHRIPFYDGENIGISLFEMAMGRTAAPFLIGGATLVTLENGRQWGRKYESMKGYIDEVRVSKGWRHAQGAIRPKRHFRADGRTIALWRFEEGPGAPFYADSSGNDYTLVAGDSLAVHPHGKLATTWGSLKRRTQFWVRHIRRNRVYSDGRYVGKFQEE